MNRLPGSQYGRTPAEIYDEAFVPALFQQWGSVVAGRAAIGPGQRVLDVACGTGALACAAAAMAEPGGNVVGLDVNPEMLAVARRKRPDLDWREGRAESLPFPDACFDAVVSQFGLMFFEDRRQSLEEMARVLRPGGRLAVAVCDSLDHAPGYAVLAALLEHLFGGTIADAFRSPFRLGDATLLQSLCNEAGIAGAEVSRHSGTARFTSVEELISTERACVWTLGGMLDEAQFERLLRESRSALRPFAGEDGAIRFEMPALLITATLRARGISN